MHRSAIPHTVSTTYGWLWGLPLLLLLLLPQPVAAQSPTPAFDVTEQCFGVADEQRGGSANTLVRINRTNGQSFPIGATDAPEIEAIAFGPNDTLYAANADRLGTLNYFSDGRFVEKPQLFGTANGTAGKVKLTDVDGLFFDIRTDTLYGVQRRGSQRPDVLFKIDPTTGAYIPGVFGGYDYVEIENVEDNAGNLLDDVDDIAVNPETGALYAAMNNGGDGGVLAEVNVVTGATTRLGEFRYASGPLAGQIIDDIEGLSFFNDGQLYGSTGNNGPDQADKDQLFRMTLPAAAGAVISTTRVGAFPLDLFDYEALACLTAKTYITLDKFTNGPGQLPQAAEAPPGPQIVAGAPVLWTYVMTNTGVLTLTDISLTDDQVGLIGPGGGSNCPPPNTILGPGDSVTCQASGVAQLGQYANTALVTALPQAGLITPRNPVSDSSVSHYFGLGLPGITLKKLTNNQDADPSNAPRLLVGSDVIWTYEVKNSGAITLRIISLIDDPAGPISCPKPELLPGESMICVKQGKVEPGLYTNLATVTAIPTSGPSTPVTHSDRSYYFGIVVESCITGRVWYDDDGTGQQNNGEDGIADVTLQLFDKANNYLTSQKTDASGQYRFEPLAAGVYTVTVVPGSSLSAARPTVYPDHKVVVPVGDYDCGPQRDFGYQLSSSSLSGRVWYDDNANRRQDPDTPDQDGETGIISVTVELLDSNNHITRTTTDINGYYRFSGLVPGAYVIQVDVASLPANTRLTHDPVPPLDHRAPVTLQRNENRADLHFGYQLPGTIGGRLWFDNNCNDQCDATERGIAGVTLLLADRTNNPLLSTQTNASGVYSFTNLPVGAYTVTVVASTLPTAVQPSFDPDDTLDHTTTVTLARNQTRNNVDFGYNEPVSSISGRVWLDRNQNALPDADEGIAAVTVTLLDNAFIPLQQTMTALDGIYTFRNLKAGVYVVQVNTVTVAHGITPYSEPDNVLDQRVVIVLGACEERNGIDFGYRLLPFGSIAGKVMYPSGNGINGVRIGLYPANNTPVVTITTSGNGDYQFTNVAPGDYLLQIDVATLPPGLIPVDDPDHMPDHTTPITLLPDRALTGLDFIYRIGDEPPGACSISGVIWLDNALAGVRDEHDHGLLGVNVELQTVAGALVTTTVTNPSGFYQFVNLASGSYLVKINPAPVQPALIPSSDPDGTPDQMTTITLDLPPCQGTADFAYQRPPGQPQLATIGGLIWNHTSARGIPAVTIHLSGAPDGSIHSTSTDETGRYTFTNLLTGTYTVTVVTATLPAGLKLISDPDGSLDHKTTVTVQAGKIQDDLHFIYQEIGQGSICGRIWRTLATTRIAWVKVALTGASSPGATFYTNGNGAYLFGTLAAGVYTITVDSRTLPPGLEPLVDPDGILDQQTVITLGAGEDRCGVDFGYQPVTPPLDLEVFVNHQDADQPTGPVLAVDAPLVWRYYVTNTKTLALRNIRIIDDNGTPANAADDRVVTDQLELAPGQSASFTYNSIATLGQYTGTATATGEPLADGTPVQDIDRTHYLGVSSIITVTPQLNGLDLIPPPGQCVQTPGTALWSYTLTNLGDQPLIDIQLTDTQLGPILCPQTNLAPQATMVCSATANMVDGVYQSTILASGQPVDSQGQPVGTRLSSKPITAAYVGQRTSIEFEKAVNGHPADKPNDKRVSGDAPVAFTYWVTNTGATTLSQPQIIDTDRTLIIQCPQLAALPPGAAWLCMATGIRAEGEYTSLATFTAQPTLDTGMSCGPLAQQVDPAYYTGSAATNRPILILEQEKDQRDIGTLHSVLATLVYSTTRQPVINEPLYIQISGHHSTTTVITTTALGQVSFTYPGIQNFMENNASQAVDQILAWSDFNDDGVFVPTGDEGDPTDTITITWQRIDIGICHDEGGTAADPVRRVSVKVTHFGESPLANCDTPQSPVQGVQIGMAVTGGTTVAPQTALLEDGLVKIFTYTTTAPRLAAAQVSIPVTPTALVQASQAVTAAQAQADTDLVTVWVDIVRDGVLDRAEPFDLIEEVTAVQLASFTLEAAGEHVIVRWATGVEYDTAGFNLYRAQSVDGDYTLVNDFFIGALGNGYGAGYEWIDRPPAPGHYYYRLEAISTQNERTTYGPLAIAFGAQGSAEQPNRVYLPSAMR